jgi:hypothetical protein
MMSFFKALENLRQKPEGQRRSIAVLLTLCFAGILVIFWLSTLGPKTIEKAKNESKGADENIASPLENIGSEFDKISDTLKQLQESLKF